MDGSNHGFTIGTDYAGTTRFWFGAGNEKGQFVSEVTAPGGNSVYSADTWFYFALVFNGTGTLAARAPRDFRPTWFRLPVRHCLCPTWRMIRVPIWTAG